MIPLISVKAESTPVTVNVGISAGVGTRTQRRPPDADLALGEFSDSQDTVGGDGAGVALGGGPGQQGRDAVDLGQPRRGIRDVGRCGGNVGEQHVISVPRAGTTSPLG